MYLWLLPPILIIILHINHKPSSPDLQLIQYCDGKSRENEIEFCCFISSVAANNLIMRGSSPSLSLLCMRVQTHLLARYINSIITFYHLQWRFFTIFSPSQFKTETYHCNCHCFCCEKWWIHRRVIIGRNAHFITLTGCVVLQYAMSPLFSFSNWDEQYEHEHLDKSMLYVQRELMLLTLSLFNQIPHSWGWNHMGVAC